MTNGFFIIGNHDRALVSGHRALSIAKDLDDLPLQIDGNFYLGQVYWALGDYPRAVDVLGWNVTALQGEFHQEIIDGTGPLAVFSRARLGVCLAEMGACIEGIGYGTEAIRMAESSEYPYSLIAAHFNTAYVYLCKGELQKAISLFERCLEVAHTLEIPTWLLCITSALGYVYALAERLADAVSLLEQALKQVDSERLNFFRRNAVLWLGESALLTCRLDDALTFAEQSLKLFREHKEQGHEAWALRLLGNIAMHHNPPDIAQAQTYYQQSLSLANELSMRPLQAHCHRSLGTLYSQTGQVEHAHTELSTAIAMYREMEMTFWLPETEAKLAEVEGR
jgi:tetratricopeptide (TPR) repeat protein